MFRHALVRMLGLEPVTHEEAAAAEESLRDSGSHHAIVRAQHEAHTARFGLRF